jgi:hypothetical protein
MIDGTKGKKAFDREEVIMSTFTYANVMGGKSSKQCFCVADTVRKRESHFVSTTNEGISTRQYAISNNASMNNNNQLR